MRFSLLLLSLLAIVKVQGQSAAPSDMPSTSPSIAPSDEPSAMPSVVPTTSPSSMPSDAPSSPPSAALSASPSMVPSDLPSASPTDVVPSDMPSVAPSLDRSPSVMPSDAPSNAPSTMPSFSPSDVPSASPSVAPSDAPSASPSRAPIEGTAAPTLAPTPVPTGMPTSAPTAAPTAATTASPTPAPTPAFAEVVDSARLVINIAGVTTTAAETAVSSSLQQAATNFYANLNRRRRSLQTINDVSDYSTRVSFVSQSLVDGSLSTTVDQSVSYTGPDLGQEIFDAPFQSQAFLDDFTSLLQDADPAFADLDGRDVSAIVTPPPSDDDGLSGGAIAGIIIGCVVGVAAAGFLAYKSKSSGGGYESANEPPRRVGGGGDDISAMDAGGQSIATTDYDYSKAYGGADQSIVSSAGGTMGENTRIAGEVGAAAALGAEIGANLKEEVIEIQAPAGKLGVVIDTPNDGPPVVHAVKDSSVIADLIQVGDRLVAVDDDDVTAMTAIKVSKLISKKSSNATRKLTVIRTSVVEGA